MMSSYLHTQWMKLHYVIIFTVWTVLTKCHRFCVLETMKICFSHFWSWRSEVRLHSWSGEGPPLGHRLICVSLHGGGANRVLPNFLYDYDDVEIAFTKAPPSWPNHPSKAPFLIPSTYEFGGMKIMAAIFLLQTIVVLFCIFLNTDKISSSYI